MARAGQGRWHTIGTLAVVVILGGVAVMAQQVRDRHFGLSTEQAQQMLYIQSPTVMRRLALSYDAVLADVYWIRALQHYGGAQRVPGAQRRYELLYPLLDLATGLDPRFNIAYRFGAIFLWQPPPGGPGRIDLAVALLEKGLREMPEKWQYYQDIGFVYYSGQRDYVEAARWFKRASEVPGSPWWLKPLAANTLARGGDREASRLLYTALAQSSENDFMRKDAVRRLQQLDVLDTIDQLEAVVQRYRAQAAKPGAPQSGSPLGPAAAPGPRPITWQDLIAARLLRGVPRDPEGLAFTLDPRTGRVTLDRSSTLLPLPVDDPASAPPQPPAATPGPAPAQAPTAPLATTPPPPTPSSAAAPSVATPARTSSSHASPRAS